MGIFFVKFQETTDGICYSNDSIVVFFGKKNCDLNQLQKLFPTFQFRGVKQTHSNHFIQSVPDSGSIEADAHWTTEKNTALLIKTADCLPIMVFEESSRKIAAIHAGWRGVAGRITPQILNTFSLIDLFIGPHILQKSFEVKEDAKALLAASVSNLDSKNYINLSSQQIKIDLEKIVVHQIGHHRIKNTYSLGIDTKTTPDFHSYRRDQQDAGRNLSFICLLI